MTDVLTNAFKNHNFLHAKYSVLKRKVWALEQQRIFHCKVINFCKVYCICIYIFIFCSGEFILEYIGEVIGPDEFEERATEYSKGKNPHYYFMSLRADAVIDATQKGSVIISLCNLLLTITL